MDATQIEKETLRLPRDYFGNPRFFPTFGEGIVGMQKWVTCGVTIEPAKGADGHVLKLTAMAFDEDRAEELWEDAHEFDLCVGKETLPFGNRPIDVMSFITFHGGSLDNLGRMMFEHLIECCMTQGWEEAELSVAKEGTGKEAELVFTLTLHGEQLYTGHVVLPWAEFADKYFILG